MRKSNLTTGYVLLLALLTLGPGCREESKVARASRDLAAALSKAPDGTGARPGGGAPPNESRVYIDATLSMAGFANQNSRYDELLDELGNALPSAQVYKFGQRGQARPENVSELVTRAGFGLEIHRPNFYDLTYNPDDRLIEFLASEESPALSVLITDGVYSEPEGSTAPPVVGAIQKWMRGGRAFGILIFRSAFKGRFYSERARSMQPPVSVGNRPFYAFVFSPTPQGFTNLRSKLRRQFGDVQAILFSEADAELSVALPEARASYAKRTPPDENYYWQMFSDDLFSDGNSARLSFGVKVKPPGDYPASSIGLDVSPEYYRWQQRQFVKAEGGPPRGFNHNFADDGRGGTAGGVRTSNASTASTPTPSPRAGGNGAEGMPAENGAGSEVSGALVLDLPKDSGCDFGFYHLRLIPSVKEVRPEILQLSTRDDRDLAAADRTFRFYELISALTDIHFKDRLAPLVSPAVFITVDNH